MKKFSSSINNIEDPKNNFISLVLNKTRKDFNHLKLRISNKIPTNNSILHEKEKYGSYNYVLEENIFQSDIKNYNENIYSQAFKHHPLIQVKNENLLIKLQQQKLKLFKSFSETLDLIIDTSNWMELQNIPKNLQNNAINKLNTNLIINENFNQILKFEAGQDFENGQSLIEDYEKTTSDLKSLLQTFLRKFQKIKDIEPMNSQLSFLESILGESGLHPTLINQSTQETLNREEELEANDMIEKCFGRFFVNVQEEKENISSFMEKTQTKEIKIQDELEKIEKKVYNKIKDLNNEYKFKEADVLNIFKELWTKGRSLEPIYEIMSKIEVSTMQKMQMIMREDGKVKNNRLFDDLEDQITNQKNYAIKDFR